MKGQGKWLAAAVLLLVFAAAKLVGLYWWQQQQPAAESLTCDIGRGCTLPNGAVLRFTPAAGLKTPFDIALSGSGAEKAVSVSFAMRDMEMGFNRYDLHRQADGGWLAQNVRLPLCTEARHDFLADVSVDGQVYRVPFTAY